MGPLFHFRMIIIVIMISTVTIFVNIRPINTMITIITITMFVVLLAFYE